MLFRLFLSEDQEEDVVLLLIINIFDFFYTFGKQFLDTLSSVENPISGYFVDL